jgi:hypothetical protein
VKSPLRGIEQPLPKRGFPGRPAVVVRFQTGDT